MEGINPGMGKKFIIPIILAFVLILARSGIIGSVYMLLSGKNSALVLDVEQEYDVKKAPMGEIYPVFSVHSIKNAVLHIVISSGEIADINTIKNLNGNYPAFSKEITANGQAYVWWDCDSNSCDIYVRSYMYGMVLGQKKITFTQKGDTLYQTEVKDIYFFYKDIILITGIVILFASIGAYLFFRGRNKRAEQ